MYYLKRDKKEFRKGELFLSDFNKLMVISMVFVNF